MIDRRFLVAAVVALAGCGGASDAPTSAPPTGARRLGIAVVSGAWQQGFVGEPLASPVRIQVVDSAGHVVSGARRIRFAPIAGSVSDTSLLTADNGSTSVIWQLGAMAGLQELVASVVDASSSAEPTRVFAEALSPNAADRVVIVGMTSGSVGLVIRKDNFTWNYTLTYPDTVLRLLPRGPANDGPAGSASWQEVTAFTIGHPPATVLEPWTSGVDTARLVLRPEIAVPFTVWVTHDFDSTAARARHDLGNIDQFWRSHMTGLRVGAVRIENVPNLVGTLAQCADPKPGYDRSAINLYYVATQVEASRPAIACDATTVLMGMNTIWSFSPEYQYLLAHEVGHALSLNHVNDDANFMSGSKVIGANITTGQIYRMHFDAWGALNSVLGVHPKGERNCSLPFSAHCPPETFVAW